MKEKTTLSEVFAPSKTLLAWLERNPSFLQMLEDIASGNARFKLHVRFGEKTRRQKW